MLVVFDGPHPSKGAWTDAPVAHYPRVQHGGKTVVMLLVLAMAVGALPRRSFEVPCQQPIRGMSVSYLYRRGRGGWVLQISSVFLWSAQPQLCEGGVFKAHLEPPMYFPFGSCTIYHDRKTITNPSQELRHPPTCSYYFP